MSSTTSKEVLIERKIIKNKGLSASYRNQRGLNINNKIKKVEKNKFMLKLHRKEWKEEDQREA